MAEELQVGRERKKPAHRIALSFPLEDDVRAKKSAHKIAPLVSQVLDDTSKDTLEVDLEGVAFPTGTTELKARADTGVLTVVVPNGVAVRVNAEVDNGTLSIPGTDVTGENVRRNYESQDYGQADRRLSLNLSVGTGSLKVVREE